jgi:hypothetical protein
MNNKNIIFKCKPSSILKIFFIQVAAYWSNQRWCYYAALIIIL